MSNCNCREKEGFIAVPQRLGTEPDQIIPAANIFYKIVGKRDIHKATLFFISGFGNNHETWQCQQQQLCKDYLTVSVDWRGVGNSSKTTGIIYNIDVFVDDFHAAEQYRSETPRRACSGAEV